MVAVQNDRSGFESFAAKSAIIEMEDPISNLVFQSLTQTTRIEDQFEGNHSWEIKRAAKTERGNILCEPLMPVWLFVFL